MMKNNNNQPLVSVIMNCFNGETYLDEAINSIVNQTYNNWELIFWDNRSTDNSKKIIDKYKDRRIKYFYSEKFTNLHEARNLALNKAGGNYIAFLDTDDFWSPYKLELQVKEIIRTKSVVLYSNCWILNKKTFLKKKIMTKNKLPSGFIFSKLLNHYVVPLPTILVEKKFLKKKNIFFNENYKIIGDFDLVMQIALNEKIVSLQEPLTTYRIHSNSFSIKNKIMQINELKSWLHNFKEKNQKIINNNLIIFKKFEDKINLQEQILLSKKVSEKFLLLKFLFKNFNFFSLGLIIKAFTPEFFKKKIFFF